MHFTSFDRIMSPLITKKLYKYQLYNYMADRELLHREKIDEVLDLEKKDIKKE